MNLRAARAELLSRSELSGAELRAALTDTADRFLAGLLGDEPGVALVAVGGYGRREPAAGSDLDLLLVHAGRVDIGEVANRVFYPVWDSGVALDHSVRTVREAVAVADGDLKAALGLLDARVVAGDAALGAELAGAARAAWRRAAPRRLAELTDALAERGRTAGELAFLLEPDLKEARGGLRDVHALRAAAAAWVVDPPAAPVLAYYELLLDVRGELHRATGRRGDRLVLQEQDNLAARLGYRDADELITAVYRAGRGIAYALDVAWRRVRAATAQPPQPRSWRRGGRPGAPERVPIADGVVEQSGEVVLARAAEPAHDPGLLLRVAAGAAGAATPISPHTLDRLVSEAAPLPEPWPAQARDSLLRLLGAGQPAIGVLEALDQAGLLVRLVPEWDRVRCRPQRNAFHRFTVDRHLAVTAAHAAALTSRVERPDLLLLGAFLHDIGKGYPGDHSVTGARAAERVAVRIGLPEADAATLARVVRHHLLLPDTATRRDLDDPATVDAVAAAVEDPVSLSLLHCLAEADGLATGPAAWGEWKAGLVADLVRRVRASLHGNPPAVPGERVAPEVRARAERGERAVLVEPGPAGHRVTLLSDDTPGLLWRCAGVLALHRLDVRAATATSVGPTAVTVFDVAPRFGSPPDWDVVRGDLRHPFTFPVAERLTDRELAYQRAESSVADPVISFDDTSPLATIVEVRGPDTVGLLYRVSRVLAEAGLDLRAARVDTIGPDAVDAFYVTEVGGGRLPEARRGPLAARLLAAARPARR